MKSEKYVVQIVLVLVAVALIVGGVRTGGYRDTWSKAIHICFECVGIG